jgi:hypothetical protein
MYFGPKNRGFSMHEECIEQCMKGRAHSFIKGDPKELMTISLLRLENGCQRHQKKKTRVEGQVEEHPVVPLEVCTGSLISVEDNSVKSSIGPYI